MTNVDIWDDINQAWEGMATPRQHCGCAPSAPCKQTARGCEDAPKNNDGRADCFWCGGPLRKVPGLNESYDYCDKCKR